jgi:hypothetical protein
VQLRQERGLVVAVRTPGAEELQDARLAREGRVVEPSALAGGVRERDVAERAILVPAREPERIGQLRRWIAARGPLLVPRFAREEIALQRAVGCEPRAEQERVRAVEARELEPVAAVPAGEVGGAVP